MRIEHIAEIKSRWERRGEVGVPETDVVGRGLQGSQDTDAYRLGFPPVSRKGHNVRAREASSKISEDFARGVTAAVVDEEEANVVMLGTKPGEAVGIKAGGFVVTWNNEDHG